MAYLLDTVAVCEATSARPNPAVLAFLDSLDPDETFLSVMTIGEIRHGIGRLPASARRRKLEAWVERDLLSRFSGRILSIDVNVINLWGRLMAEVEAKGRPLPMADSLIAATARAWDLELVTRNQADFESTGVRIVNPWL
jgi:toxin FitB